MKANGATCKTCGKQIFWAKTIKGHNIPMDMSPSTDGLFVLVQDGGSMLALHVSDQDQRAKREVERGAKRYQSHFSTCPDAAQHRGMAICST